MLEIQAQLLVFEHVGSKYLQTYLNADRATIEFATVHVSSPNIWWQHGTYSN